MNYMPLAIAVLAIFSFSYRTHRAEVRANKAENECERLRNVIKQLKQDK